MVVRFNGTKVTGSELCSNYVVIGEGGRRRLGRKLGVKVFIRELITLLLISRIQHQLPPDGYLTGFSLVIQQLGIILYNMDLNDWPP